MKATPLNYQQQQTEDSFGRTLIMDINMYSPTEIKTLAITPMISGAASFLGSALLIVTMLFMSETKLSAPSRRILFGLCVYDCFSSLASALSSLPIPKDGGIWGAMGNVQTCDLQGFLMHFGVTGSLFYNCNLVIFYLCLVTFSMSETTFRRKIEPFCHVIPNLYALGGAIYLFTKGYFNSIGNMCWIGPYPIDCITDPDTECLRGGEDAYRMRWIFFGYAVYVVWALIFLSSIMIGWRVFLGARSRRGRRNGNGRELPRRARAQPVRDLEDDEFSDDDDSSDDEDSDNDLQKFSARLGSQSDRGVSVARGAYPARNLQIDGFSDDEESGNGNGNGSGFDNRADRTSVKLPHARPMHNNKSLSSSVGNQKQSDQTGENKCVKFNAAAPRPDALSFDLKAMRAKAGSSVVKKELLSQDIVDQIKAQAIPVRQSLRRASVPGYQRNNPCRYPRSYSSKEGRPYVDPNPFDLKAVRAKVNRLSSQTSSMEEPPTSSASSSGHRPLRASSRASLAAKNVGLEDAKNVSSEDQPSSEEGPNRVQRATTSENLDRAMKTVATQALLYALAFAVSWVFPAVVRIMEHKGRHPPFVIFFLSRLTSPLQGLFNVFVYARPYARLLRHRHPEYSWFKVYYLTLKTGGDGDLCRGGSRNYTRASTTLFSEAIPVVNPYYDDDASEVEDWECS